jgi:small subunit ribosomal protein S1
MVNNNRYPQIKGGPPPLDESWWEAVLAEDEAKMAPPPLKSEVVFNDFTPEKPKPAYTERDTMDWHKAIELYEEDQTVEMDVNGYNRGGLLVSNEDLQGFVPISHLVEMTTDPDNPEKWLSSYVGRLLTLKVIECDEERGRVVFSERAALAEPGSRNQLLDQLKPGDCIRGSVTNITDFGVFVDLGGVEGLIHVSEISWGRVRHPADVLELGQQVEVYVIQVDRERARVALSLKRLRPNPWETAHERYFPGQTIEATITSIVPFGAFARLEEGLDGLIHISEMCPDGSVTNPADILREGQRVRVQVLHVDGSRQRLGLSMNVDDPNPQGNQAS